MSFRDCLVTAVKAKELTQEEADQLNAAYEQIRAGKRARMGDAAADIAARDELAARLTAEAAEKKRQAGLTQVAVDGVRTDVTGYRDARGRPDIAEAIIRLFEHYGRTGYSSVMGKAKAIIGAAHADMEVLLHEFRRTAVAGTRMNKARLDNVVRELFGQSTGDVAAKEMADAWKRVAEGLRERFNAAGGAIAELKDWGLPQGHDRRAMMRAGKEAWKAYVLPRLDGARMVNPLTGEALSPAELPAALDHVWDTIITEGWNTREPSRSPFGKGALANQRQDHRFLVFKSADAWLEYSREFGRGDPFAIMMNHINLMARDIAAMERFGPNPNATIEWLRQIIRQEAAKAANKDPESLFRPGAGGARSADSAREIALRQVDGLWDRFRGAAELPERQWLATAGSVIRNITTGARLGASTLSAATGDPVTMAAAAKFMDMPMTLVAQQVARQMQAGSRREAVAAGLILDDAMHILGAGARWQGALSGPEWSQRIPDRVLTYNGLQALTQAEKHGWGRSIQAYTAGQMDRRWANLPEGYRRVIEGYGLKEADWEVIQKAVPEHNDEARFLRPQDIAATGAPNARDIAERYMQMILGETEYAVPSGTERGRVAFIGRTRPGTFVGEFMRSAAMFRGFSVSMVLTQGGRYFAEVQAGRGARSAKFVGATFIALTLGGMLRQWLGDIIQGRDPQPLSTEFVIASMLQGGGMGIFGDFVFADYNRFGNSLASTIAGPGVSFVGDTWNLTGGNVVEMLKGKPTNAASELSRWLRNYLPFGNIWYVNAAYQRVIMDQLQHAIDPRAAQKFKRRVQEAERERHQGYWWRPGEVAPRRAPQFGGN